MGTWEVLLDLSLAWPFRAGELIFHQCYVKPRGFYKKLVLFSGRMDQSFITHTFQSWLKFIFQDLQMIADSKVLANVPNVDDGRGQLDRGRDEAQMTKTTQDEVLQSPVQASIAKVTFANSSRKWPRPPSRWLSGNLRCQRRTRCPAATARSPPHHHHRLHLRMLRPHKCTAFTTAGDSQLFYQLRQE